MITAHDVRRELQRQLANRAGHVSPQAFSLILGLADAAIWTNDGQTASGRIQCGSWKHFALSLGAHPTTILSKLSRAKLPAPHKVMVAMRVYYVARLREENRDTLDSIASQIGMSSGQALCRTIRTYELRNHAKNSTAALAHLLALLNLQHDAWVGLEWPKKQAAA